MEATLTVLSCGAVYFFSILTALVSECQLTPLFFLVGTTFLMKVGKLYHLPLTLPKVHQGVMVTQWFLIMYVVSQNVSLPSVF